MLLDFFNIICKPGCSIRSCSDSVLVRKEAIALNTHFSFSPEPIFNIARVTIKTDPFDNHFVVSEAIDSKYESVTASRSSFSLISAVSSTESMSASNIIYPCSDMAILLIFSLRAFIIIFLSLLVPCHIQSIATLVPTFVLDTQVEYFHILIKFLHNSLHILTEDSLEL
ncbi:hypothetical protein V1478_009289 [Vespula squamosa]|uniref:Uncharacterized protein n=1 Tax=Vespula squamosa TaxID=30214 RepID=A0ABD2AP91_VESSQ